MFTRSSVVAALCAAVGIAAGCQETRTPPVAAATVVGDSADQVMYGVWFMLHDAGIRRAAVRADTAFMYDQNTRTELRQLNTEFFTASGEKNATLTGREGTYNARLGTMEARGNVVVISTEGRKLETPQLRYDPSRNEVSSDSAFVLTEAGRRVEGVGFISDPDMNNIRVLKGAKATGQAVTIPKQ